MRVENSTEKRRILRGKERKSRGKRGSSFYSDTTPSPGREGEDWSKYND